MQWRRIYCLIKHHAIKRYWGSVGTIPHILNLCTRSRDEDNVKIYLKEIVCALVTRMMELGLIKIWWISWLYKRRSASQTGSWTTKL